jgi:nucleotide-binding universal stress UspA family protein
MMILISYDGSSDAQAAIERAAQLMPGSYATVLTVWLPYVSVLPGNSSPGMGMGMAGSYAYPETRQIDEATRHAASGTAEEGAQRASAAGLIATSLLESRNGDVAATILQVATEIDADVIAMGTRGRSGVRAYLLGSVSRFVVEHADRVVLVIPSPSLVARRRERAGHDTERQPSRHTPRPISVR